MLLVPLAVVILAVFIMVLGALGGGVNPCGGDL